MIFLTTGLIDAFLYRRGKNGSITCRKRALRYLCMRILCFMYMYLLYACAHESVCVRVCEERQAKANGEFKKTLSSNIETTTRLTVSNRHLPSVCVRLHLHSCSHSLSAERSTSFFLLASGFQPPSLSLVCSRAAEEPVKLGQRRISRSTETKRKERDGLIFHTGSEKLRVPFACVCSYTWEGRGMFWGPGWMQTELFSCVPVV